MADGRVACEVETYQDDARHRRGHFYNRGGPDQEYCRERNKAYRLYQRYLGLEQNAEKSKYRDKQE